MPHIHNGPDEYDHTVSAYILREEKGSRRVLLHKHRLLGIWLQPGGHIELKENPSETLQHEILAETGYDFDQLYLLQPEPIFSELTEREHPLPLIVRSHPFPNKVPHKHTDSAYALVAFDSPKNKVAEGESEDIKWFSYKELAELGEEEIPADTRIIGKALLSGAADHFVLVPAIGFI